MSSKHLEEPHTRIINVVLEALCQVELGGYEYRVVYAIIRKTWGFQQKDDRIPVSQIVELTKIHKAHISRALKSLISRKIVTKNGNKLGIQKNVKLWKMEKLPKMVTPKKLPDMVTPVTKNGNKKLPKMADSKESKETNKRNNVSTNVIENENPEEKINYYAELIAKELGDMQSLDLYKKACKFMEPNRLLEKAKEIVKDGGAKKPGAVFTAWYLKEARKLLIAQK